MLCVILIHQVGTGLLAALVPVRLATDGFPAWVAGAMSTGFSIGFVFGSLLAPATIALLRPKRAIAVLASANGACALLLWMSPDPFLWTFSRTAAGFATASLFSLIEAWLGQQAPAASRGRVFGLYMLFTRLMFTVGQLSLTVIDPKLGALFLIAATAYFLSPIPAYGIATAGPHIDRRARPNLMEIARQAPAAAVGAIGHGFITMAGMSLFPIYGVAMGMPVEQIALALAAMQFGGFLTQMPMAVASDKIGRRTVMAGGALVTAIVSFTLLAYPSPPLAVLLVLSALWGGAPAPIYSIAAAHASDLAQDHQRLPWMSGLLMIWGGAAAVGPLAAAVLMDQFAVDMLFVYTGVLSVGLTLFLAWRKSVRPPPAVRKPIGERASQSPGANTGDPA
jgi:MFS family permease